MSRIAKRRTGKAPSVSRKHKAFGPPTRWSSAMKRVSGTLRSPGYSTGAIRRGPERKSGRRYRRLKGKQEGRRAAQAARWRNESRAIAAGRTRETVDAGRKWHDKECKANSAAGRRWRAGARRGVSASSASAIFALSWLAALKRGIGAALCNARRDVMDRTRIISESSPSWNRREAGPTPDTSTVNPLKFEVNDKLSQEKIFNSCGFFNNHIKA